MGSTTLLAEDNTVIMRCRNIVDKQQGRRVEPDKFTLAQEWIGLAIYSMLFAIWGLAYGMLDIMNYHIKVALGAQRSEVAQLALAYYSAYFTVGFFAGPITTYFGYRVAAVVGIVVLAVGTFAMSEGAAMLALPVMCGAHFVVGLGVSTLERCANAYAVQAGPGKRRTIRELIGQSMAAFGTVIAPLIANAAIYEPEAAAKLPTPDPLHPGRCLVPELPPKDTVPDLSKVVSFYRYLGAGLLVFALFMAMIFFRTTLVVEPAVPEVSKRDHPQWQFWKSPLFSRKYTRTLTGAAANFLNLGCQVAVAQFFLEHMRVNGCQTDGNGAQSMMIAQILFLVGRLLAAALIELPLVPCLKKFTILQSILRPRVILSTCLGLATLFTGLGINATGPSAIALACAIMLFEAPSFPMLFEQASAGLGELSSSAETVVITSIAGGGFLSPAMGVFADKAGISASWSLPTSAFALVFAYSALCNLIPSWRQTIDKAHGEGDEREETPDVELVQVTNDQEK